jgi:hypothetical protein
MLSRRKDAAWPPYHMRTSFDDKYTNARRVVIGVHLHSRSTLSSEPSHTNDSCLPYDVTFKPAARRRKGRKGKEDDPETSDIALLRQPHRSRAITQPYPGYTFTNSQLHTHETQAIILLSCSHSQLLLRTQAKHN